MKIFVGSSGGAKSQAKKFMEGCIHPNVKYLPWWEQFPAGRTLLDELDRIRNNVDGAILLITPEAVGETPRGAEQVFINQNVLFEFGYLYAALGRKNVALVKYGAAPLPSDLGGYIHIFGSSFYKPNAVVAIGKRTKTEFTKWTDALFG